MQKVVVLRWGHRERDKRLTTHVALTARALKAAGFILSDVEDEKVKTAVDKVVERWGGPFHFEMGKPWKWVVHEWRESGGVTVHLTAYGENIQCSDVLERVKATGKDVLVIVGSRKVPPEFFLEKTSDFNVAVGNQPHSECSSLAVFLDRFFEGEELQHGFDDAQLKVIPEPHGKRVRKTLRGKSASEEYK